MLRRQYANDVPLLRELYLMVEDREAVAALDNATIHQAQTIVTDR